MYIIKTLKSFLIILIVILKIFEVFLKEGYKWKQLHTRYVFLFIKAMLCFPMNNYNNFTCIQF